ncbi:hypothetical protein Daura_34530 [Dactylosporangium aurantiacum]|uniref:Uncharacterized protein n=1 Tax=Dactylosporangium aurantiacum TaxID=35754 RepID=A0A9Q9ICD1_9ACTN|nr:hypothetical protein [Dactylosporangium aurantiacum]MDG6107875.1 hypothetical protein [Dactylosporangium aurantiacum]UWZ51813.1 hypothetical protein Daura_34530 [Dactylosporangium aurantiacum]
MGYAFSFDPPTDEGYASTPCAFNGEQMNYVRLIMIEAGAIAGDGFEQALRTPGLEPGEQTLRARRFQYNEGHVTAAEAAFVAGRLRAAAEAKVAAELLSFYDEHPGVDQVTAWVEQFAAFNEQAAARDGYYIC